MHTGTSLCVDVSVLLASFVGESTRDTNSFTDSYSQSLPPRSATPDSPPQIPRVTFKPVVQDIPEMDEMPPTNTVVLSDLYALTTKVCLLWLCEALPLRVTPNILLKKNKKDLGMGYTHPFPIDMGRCVPSYSPSYLHFLHYSCSS